MTDKRNDLDSTKHSADAADDDERVEAIIVFPRRPAVPGHAPDPYDLGQLFLCWAWEARFHGWPRALQALARTLRGLEQNGLIERRRVRRPGRPTHHGFT